MEYRWLTTDPAKRQERAIHVPSPAKLVGLTEGEFTPFIITQDECGGCPGRGATCTGCRRGRLHRGNGTTTAAYGQTAFSTPLATGVVLKPQVAPHDLPLKSTTYDVSSSSAEVPAVTKQTIDTGASTGIDCKQFPFHPACNPDGGADAGLIDPCLADPLLEGCLPYRDKPEEIPSPTPPNNIEPGPCGCGD